MKYVMVEEKLFLINVTKEYCALLGHYVASSDNF
jgi:hypothetical protein